MNAPQSYYDANLRSCLKDVEGLFQIVLHGKVISYAACDTLLESITQYMILAVLIKRTNVIIATSSFRLIWRDTLKWTQR